MIKKTVLISETNEKIANEIITILEKMKNEIIILDSNPKTSLKLYENIIAYKPDIVITNENKKDYPASDIIQRIQSNLEIYQPEFVIISDYKDIENICRKKCIIAYCIEKPFQNPDIMECIESIMSKIQIFVSKNIKFEKNFNYSKKNLEYIEKFITEKERYYNNSEYRIELLKQYKLFDKIEKAFWENPLKDIENPINDFDEYKDRVYKYKLCFLYQYLLHH